MRVRVNRALVHLREWSGVAALLLALTGGVAYAANTIASSDIIDGQVKTPDLANGAVNTAKIADGQVKTADLGDNAVNSSKIANGQVTEADIGQAAVANSELKNDAVTTQKVLNGTLLGADVQDNTLKGADIDESTLSGIGGGGTGSVRGLRFNHTIPADGRTEARTVLDLPPLRLTAVCNKLNQDSAGHFRLEATSSAEDAGIDIGYALDAGGADTFGGFVGTTPLDLVNLTGFTLTRRLVGNIVYSDPATSISIPFAVFFESNEAADTARCFLAGTATRSGV